MTVVAASADTAVVKTVDVRKFFSTVINTNSCTINHTDAAGGLKTIVITCTGANPAEIQLNANKVQDYIANLMAQSHLGTVHSKVYVMNQGTITDGAGLIHSTAGTEPLVSSAITL